MLWTILNESEKLDAAHKNLKNKFKDFNCNQISDYSHEEKGWIENSNGSLISYEYAKMLNVKSI